VTGSVFFISLVIQFILIWHLYPHPRDFVPVRTISGEYTYRKSTGSNVTLVAKHVIFCHVSFLGSENYCGNPHAEGKTVTATIGRYRHLFGMGETVVKLVTADGQILFNPSDEQLVAYWQSESIFHSINVAVVISAIFNALRQFYLIKRKEKDDS